MLHTFSHQYQLPTTVIHPGEFHVDGPETMISTILGSCVSVVLHAPTLGITGMNHYMLPRHLGSQQVFADDAGRYGLQAMEQLLNAVLKAGAPKNSLVAKVFGGGHVLNIKSAVNLTKVNSDDIAEGIPDGNIRLAMEFLALENIPILSSDTGGSVGRKLFVFCSNGRVLLKRFQGQSMLPTVAQELSYLEHIKHAKKKQGGEATLF